jgi:hypothetical protein
MYPNDTEVRTLNVTLYHAIDKSWNVCPRKRISDPAQRGHRAFEALTTTPVKLLSFFVFPAPNNRLFVS